MADGSNNIEITIKTPKDKVKLTISPTITIKDLKVLVAEKFSAGVGQLVIIFSGKILKDDATVESYHIKNDNTVHLVIKSSSSSSSGQGSTNSESKPATTTPQPTTQNAPSGGGLPFNLGSMGGLGDLGGLGSGMNMQEMQQQMMNNPAMMAQMMQNPMVQSMLNNPDILQSMITNNPQMQELMQRNPEITHILNNPWLMQQTLEMAQNPAMLQEMMRNQDRAMSNLESIPGGYNALRRMYTDIQEPMLNAAQDQFGQNPFTALAGGNQADPETQNTENVNPLPNPWQSGSTQSTRTNTASTNRTSTATGTADSKPTTTPSSNNMFNNPAMQNLMQQINGNPAMMQGMLNSPYMQNMMRSLSSNPQLAQQMLSQNPMFANNPQMQEMLPTMLEQMQRPEMQQLMTNPEAMEAMMQIQRGMATLEQQAPGFFPGGAGLNPGGAANPTNPSANQPNLAQMMQNLATTTPQQPPEDRFRQQLEQLQQMGFYNREENIQALVRTGGNLSRAIEDLLK